MLAKQPDGLKGLSILNRESRGILGEGRDFQGYPALQRLPQSRYALGKG